MTKTMYVNFDEVNKLQTDIMYFVDVWVHVEKTPVPHREILDAMSKRNVGVPTTVNAINSLLHKGYLRRAVVISNKTYYVQLRRLQHESQHEE